MRRPFLIVSVLMCLHVPLMAQSQTATIRVLVRGGDELSVNFQRSGQDFTGVTLSGPADFVFEGTVAL